MVSGLVAAIEHFSGPGSAVILPTPAYMPFLVVPRATGPRGHPGADGPDDGRAVATTSTRIDAAFGAGGGLLVLCNPHNPRPGARAATSCAALAEVVERHGGRVFSDEIHAPLVYDGHRHVPYATVSAAAAGHTVTATSASKAWNLPGTKCAQLVLSATTRTPRRWAEVGVLAEHGASNLGRASRTSRRTTTGGPWLAEVLAYLDGNRRLLAELLAEHLPEIRYTPAGGHLPRLAGLPCARPRRPSGRVLPRARRGRADRRAGLRRLPAPASRATTSRRRAPMLEQIVDQMARPCAAADATVATKHPRDRRGSFTCAA